MAIKVNLMPAELVLSGGLNRILKVSRMLGVILLAGFLIFGLGLAAFFIISSVQLSGLNSGNTDLKNQITTLETSEQKIVLLKDRIGNIKKVQSIPTFLTNLGNIEPVLAAVTAGSSVSELDIDPTKVSTTINFKSNGDLTTFITSVTKQSVFKSILLSAFGYNPASGYLVTLTFSAK